MSRIGVMMRSWSLNRRRIAGARCTVSRKKARTVFSVVPGTIILSCTVRTSLPCFNFTENSIKYSFNFCLPFLDSHQNLCKMAKETIAIHLHRGTTLAQLYQAPATGHQVAAVLIEEVGPLLFT
jgi:hypothetical protein